MGEHARFSPSSAERWLACPASVPLSEGAPDTPTVYQAEGTVAHDLALAALRGGDVRDFVGSTRTVDGFEITVDEDMARHAEDYREYVKRLCDSPHSVVYTEHRMDGAHEEHWGTADAAIVAPGAIHVVDYKYGRGVPVSPKDNPQLMSYLLGACAIHRVRFGVGAPAPRLFMHIVQPRTVGANHDTTTHAALADFKRRVLDARKAADYVVQHGAPWGVFPHKGRQPLPDQRAGAHCLWCPFKAHCAVLADHAVEQARKVFDTPKDVPTRTLGEILGAADMIDAWIGAVRQEALRRAEAGEKIDGFKLVQKRATRQWVDEKKAADTLTLAGFDPWGDKPLMSPAQIEKRYGRKDVQQMLAALARAVSSGVTLVPDTDPRDAVTPEAAKADEARAVFK